MKLIYFGKNGHKSNIFSEPLILNNLVDKLKILGVHWNEKLSWRDHFDYVIAKCNSRLHAINVTKRLLNYDELWLLFHSTVVSLIGYAVPLFGKLEKSILQDIRSLYKRCSKIVCERNCTCKNTPTDLQIFRDRLGLKLLAQAERETTHPLNHLIPPRHTYTNTFVIPYCKTQRLRNTFVKYYVLIASNIPT